MKTALRRELEAAGWRALGFFGALVALAGGIFLWGLHIEGRVDQVVVERQHDHRVIERLAEGKPVVRHQLQANSKEVQNLELGGDEGRAPKATGGTTGVKPPKGGSTKPPAPGKGGSKGEEAPTKSPASGQAPPTLSTTATPAGTSIDQTPPPANSSTSEASPGLIGNPGGVVGEVACSATDAVNELAGVRVCSK